MPVKKAQEPSDVVKQVYTLTSGVKFTTKPVPALLVYGVQQRTKLPKPPVKLLKHGGQTYVTEDYDNEGFQAALEEAQRKRNIDSMDVMFRHGVELVPGQLPEDKKWLRKLEIDIPEEIDRYRNEDGDIPEEYIEYLYLRYVAIQDQEDFRIISDAVMMRAGEIEEATENFQ